MISRRGVMVMLLVCPRAQPSRLPMHRDPAHFITPPVHIAPPSNSISLTEIDATDQRDGHGLGHSRRVAILASRLARAIGQTPQFIAHASLAGLLHDVGKRHVPRAILTKPGKLTPDETVIVRKHPREGFDMLRVAVDIPSVLSGILHHHERFDGAGYPDGLYGDRIPLVARIICIADSFDAMTSWRPYKRALCLGEAMRELQQHAGTHFDPSLIQAFCRVDLEIAQTQPVPAYLQRRRAA